MESIIQRLQPKDRHHIREMISFRGLVSGSLASMTAVFWWISVDKGGDSLGDVEIPVSLIGGFTFREISIIVPLLALAATFIMSVGRETGNAIMNNIGGILIVIILFYILEPLGNAIMGPEIATQVAVFASGRLVAMALMLGMATTFFWDAILLQWVRSTMMNLGVDLFPPDSNQELPSATDEVLPPLG
tara:strand:- start:114 stop:680 length:567 start_codon:yes stop_codon:yes gene_type:complete